MHLTPLEECTGHIVELACTVSGMHQTEQFRGNLCHLAALMKRSWASNNQEPLLYTEQFLRSMFQQPDASFNLCSAIYEQNELIAFGAGFIRNIVCGGKLRRLLFESFLTVAPTARGKNLGGAIWHDVLARARQRGLDGAISFCVDGEAMDRKLARFTELSPTTTSKAFTVTYLARPIPKTGIRDRQRADPKLLLSKSRTLKTEFCRLWTGPEATWQCDEREGAFGCSFAKGDQMGTISAYAMLTGGAKPICCGLVDDVLWDGTDDTQRSHMIDLLLNSARGSGVELLLVPMLKYFDPEPFVAAGFRRTRRTLNMYLTSFNGSLVPDVMDAVYVDVF